MIHIKLEQVILLNVCQLQPPLVASSIYQVYILHLCIIELISAETLSSCWIVQLLPEVGCQFKSKCKRFIRMACMSGMVKVIIFT